MQPTVDAAEIERAAHLLREGGLVAFPTETVYGLGANALNAEAVARIYSVKRRPPTSPLIVHVDSIEMAQGLVRWNKVAERLAQKFWPGPLTLVLEKEGKGLAIPAMVSANLPTIGIRVPAHPVARALIKASNLPLAAPSANRFSQISPTTAEHVRQGLGSEVDMILDGGPCGVGIESTVISLAGGRPALLRPALLRPALLRPGGVSRTALEDLIGPLGSSQEGAAAGHASPGMHPKHYSPRTPLFLVTDGRVPDSGRGIYLQLSTEPTRVDNDVHRMPLTPTEYATHLYIVLHSSDAGTYDWIAVERPPDSDAWEAVLDRLTRAASG